MSSISANRQWQRAHEIANSAIELAPRASQALDRLFAPFGREGESPPSWALSQELLGRLAQGLGERLIQQDDAFANAQLEQRRRREQREAAADALRERLGNARVLFRRLYGTGKGITLVGFDARVRQQNPVQAARIGRQLVDLLRQPAFEFPGADPSLVVPSPLGYADLIEEPLLRLEVLLEQENPAKVGIRHAQGQRDQTLAEAKAGVQRCFDFLVALYKLAGLDFHAEQLRSAMRRRKSPSTDPPEGSPPGKQAADLGVPATSPPAAGESGVVSASQPRKVRRRRVRRALLRRE